MALHDLLKLLSNDLRSVTLTGITAVITVVFGGVTLARTLRWKRVELASTYLKEFNQSQELQFACRCLDWDGVKLVVPDSLRPLLPNDEKTIDLNKSKLARAMRLHVAIAEVEEDPDLLVYRTAMDLLLSWFQVLANAIDRDLFEPRDLPGMAYWVYRVSGALELKDFSKQYEYTNSITALAEAFAAVEPKFPGAAI